MQPPDDILSIAENRIDAPVTQLSMQDADTLEWFFISESELSFVEIDFGLEKSFVNSVVGTVQEGIIDPSIVFQIANPGDYVVKGEHEDSLTKEVRVVYTVIKRDQIDTLS